MGRAGIPDLVGHAALSAVVGEACPQASSPDSARESRSLALGIFNQPAHCPAMYSAESEVVHNRHSTVAECRAWDTNYRLLISTAPHFYSEHVPLLPEALGRVFDGRPESQLMSRRLIRGE